MAIQEDTFIDPNNKARWGFSGSEGNIKVGPQTVGETGGVDAARSPISDDGAGGNGGGLDSGTGGAIGGADTDPRDSLTIPQIKEQLDAKQVAYPSTANKPELLDLLKAQPQE